MGHGNSDTADAGLTFQHGPVLSACGPSMARPRQALLRHGGGSPPRRSHQVRQPSTATDQSVSVPGGPEKETCMTYRNSGKDGPMMSTDPIAAAADFVALQPGGPQRILSTHARDGNACCTSCGVGVGPVQWPCTVAAIALAAQATIAVARTP